MNHLYPSKIVRWVLLCCLISTAIGCGYIIDPPKPYSGWTMNTLCWSTDGTKLFVSGTQSDTSYESNFGIYDSTGTLIQEFDSLSFATGYYSQSAASSDPQSLLFQQGSLNPFVMRYFPLSDSTSIIAGGYIYAISPDRRLLLLGPTSYYNTISRMLVVDVSGPTPRTVLSWNEDIGPSRSIGVWLSSTRFAYPSHNSLNLEHLVIRDTSGVILDSIEFTHSPFDPGSMPANVCFAQGTFFFSTSAGVTRVDSATKQISTISADVSSNMQIAQDASFVVYRSSTNYQVSILNLKTGRIQSLGISPSFFVLSPDSRHLAVSSRSSSKTLPKTIDIRSVSAP